MTLLSIQQLQVSFPRFQPVQDVSLIIRKGEFVGLVGESGSGKSTVAMALLRLQNQARYQGKIVFQGQDLLTLTEKEMQRIRGRRIAMIFQEPMTSLNPLHTVGQQIGEVLRLHVGKVSRHRIKELLRLVELTDIERIYRSYPHELSGGQRQRVMIAMALAGEPELLIADEPTTALDVTVQAQILRLLKSLQDKIGLSILFITHDLSIVQRLANRVYVMNQGKTSASQIPVAVPMKRTSFPGEKRSVLSVNGVTVCYGKTVAAQNISFQVEAGKTIAVVGESGSGKSTVARALVRLVDAKGQVILNGRDFLVLKGRALMQARSEIQMVFQDAGASLNPRLSVGQLVAEGWALQQSGSPDIAVAEVLESVGLNPDIVGRYPHELSGGQRTRVALARALIMHPSVLVLDEVTSSLDVQTQCQIIDLLNRIQSTLGLAYIFISHDMRAVQAVSDDVAVMRQGKIVEYGTVREVFQNPKNAYTRQLLKDSFFDGDFTNE